jgi:hypothetical protein
MKLRFKPLNRIIQDSIREGMIALVQPRHAAEVMLGQCFQYRHENLIREPREAIAVSAMMKRNGHHVWFVG